MQKWRPKKLRRARNRNFKAPYATSVSDSESRADGETTTYSLINEYFGATSSPNGGFEQGDDGSHYPARSSQEYATSGAFTAHSSVYALSRANLRALNKNNQLKVRFPEVSESQAVGQEFDVGKIDTDLEAASELPPGFEEQAPKIKQEVQSPRSSRIREDLPPINVSTLFKTTWETASASTSVMSSTTKAELSNILVPFNSFDKTHDLLQKYCEEGKASAVKFLLQKGCNPGTKQRPRRGPLLAAIRGASQRHNKCVRELIKHNVDVDVRSNSNPALHLAVENPPSNSYVKLIWLLIMAGADLDRPDGNGDSALTKLFAGADSRPLEKHRLEALALLLHSGVAVNQHAPGTGNTPLHLAVRRKDKWAVAMLLYKGADVNAKNCAGSTPLQLTANQFHGELSPDHAKVLDLLLKSQASIDERSGALQRTALHLAVVSGTAYAVRLLLNHGANPSLLDAEGKNSMQLAIQGAAKLTSEPDRVDDHVEIMDLLVRVLAKNWPEARQRPNGMCAVEAACSEGGYYLLDELMALGDLRKNSKFRDETLLSLAERKGVREAVELLESIW